LVEFVLSGDENCIKIPSVYLIVIIQ